MIVWNKQKGFNTKAIRSFKKAKDELESVKQSTHEWITFLHRNQDILQHRIQQLELELEKLKTLKH